MTARCVLVSEPGGRPVPWHDPGVRTLTDPATAARVEDRPDLALPALAAALRSLAAALHPADLVTFQQGSIDFVLGRHELAGLAMLFEEWDLDAETRVVATTRARAWLSTATVVPASP